MKTTLCFTLILLTFVTIAFVPNSFAQDTDPEYVVRVIYFVPNDREPDPTMNEKLDTLIKDIQKFYADQMEAHGFERKTFRFEADDAGDVIVHHVNGNFNAAYYQNPATGSWIAWREIEELFDLSRNIYFLVLDINSIYLDGKEEVIGRASGHNLGGRTLIPASNFGAAHHELGHAFGLFHDSRVDANMIFTLPGYYDQMTNSFCAAEWLDVNRYFNPTQEAINENTDVKILAPSLAAPPSNIRLQFEVTDSDGLHQAQLFKPYGHYPSVIAYQSLNGNRTTVEFVTHELVDGNTIILWIIDKHGNVKQHSFPIETIDLLPSPEIISISDPNLAAAIQNTLNLSGNTITQLDMGALVEIRANEKDIKNLTGLEHARYLRLLELTRNQIKDLTPLAELQNLQYLQLLGNQITDLTPLANLQNLIDLRLLGNPISDITPISKLPRLQWLHLSGSDVNDISPLVGLPNLFELHFSYNPTNDLTPISKLSNLINLGLSGMSISDITFIKGMTNLGFLFLQTNNISNLEPLAVLTNLRILNLAANNISDVTPLAALTQLEILFLNRNRISDVSPLTGLVNLKELYLVGNPIKNRKPIFELLEKNPDVKIYLKSFDEPLPVNLSRFRAEHTKAGVILNWTTESEVDNAGFYIYRSPTKDGEFKVVNPTMVQGAGTTGERNEYTWTDTTAKPNTVYYYRIEDVSHAGVREQLATVRLRGLVSARGKLTTIWADLKAQE